jgi:hypothetical protein
MQRVAHAHWKTNNKRSFESVRFIAFQGELISVTRARLAALSSKLGAIRADIISVKQLNLNCKLPETNNLQKTLQSFNYRKTETYFTSVFPFISGSSLAALWCPKQWQLKRNTNDVTRYKLCEAATFCERHNEMWEEQDVDGFENTSDCIL